MSEVIPFDFGESVVRVHQGSDGNPWFVAKDVCNVLEHSNSRKAIQDLDGDEKGVTNCYTPGGKQEVATISESGLYALIFKSRKPEAKKFRKWITSEVIPSLRRTGCYSLTENLSSTAPTKEEFQELYQLLTEWGTLLRDNDVWEAHLSLQNAVCCMMISLGEEERTPVSSLTTDKLFHACEYLKMQITNISGAPAQPVQSAEELEKARIRSEKARKSARARWDKAKAIGN